MMATAADIITGAMRLFGIVDQMENPTPTDIANNVVILNDLLRHQHMDGAAQYLMSRVTATLPPGVSGQVYSFSIGVEQSAYLVQTDAVGVKSLWCNDVGGNVNRETRMAPTADVVRTTYPGRITKWHPERQVDGSILVTAWQPPRSATKVLIEVGGRVPALTNAAGTDVVPLPPEGIFDAKLLLGRAIFGSYGRSPQAVASVLADSERVHAKWTDWAKGQQWLRMVRA